MAHDAASDAYHDVVEDYELAVWKRIHAMPLYRSDNRRPHAVIASVSAVVQATEESVINAMVAAKTMTGADYWVVSALPHDQLQQVLRKHGMLKQ